MPLGRRLGGVAAALLGCAWVLLPSAAIAATPAIARVVLVSSVHLTPDPVRYAANVPGTVVLNTYRAEDAAGQPVTATLRVWVTHGDPISGCVDSTGTPSYSACGGGQAIGIRAGDLSATLYHYSSAEANWPVVTAADGTFRVPVSVGRDPGFDVDGLVTSRVRFTTDDGTATPIAGGSSIMWTTDAVPLNGYQVPTYVAVDPPSLVPGGSGVVTSVPANRPVVYAVHLFDQFGNLTSGGAVPATTLISSGDGTLTGCPGYTSTDPCLRGGVATTTVTGWRGSYQSLAFADGRLAQQRFESRSTGTTTPCGFGGQSGVQDLSINWDAPITVADGTNGWRESTTTERATAVINFYAPLGQDLVSVRAQPSTHLHVGDAVQLTATVTTSIGDPVSGDEVTFTPSFTPSQWCTAGATTLPTNGVGQVDWFTSCQRPGVLSVSVDVLDSCGNNIGHVVAAVTFATYTSTTHVASTQPHTPTTAVTSPVVRGSRSSAALPMTGAPNAGAEADIGISLITLGAVITSIGSYNRRRPRLPRRHTHPSRP